MSAQGMLCRRGSAPKDQLSTLPLDILQKVASLMPLKDWAKASGACRIMHTLQLDIVDVAEPSFCHTCGLMPKFEQQRIAGAEQAHPEQISCMTSCQHCP